MEGNALLASLRMRLPDAGEKEDALLIYLLEAAASLIRALTWRDEVPPGLHDAQVHLAAIYYSRMGMEGEKEHSEGDIRRVADDLPEGLRREIFAYRRALT